MRSVEVVAKKGFVGTPRSGWGGINRHAVIWRDISCKKHFGYVFFCYVLVEIYVPIYYDDPEPLIPEPNQHYSIHKTGPTQPHRPNPYRPNPTHLTQPTTHHTPPTHHTHPIYHPEGTMHICLRPPTTTTTTTQPTPPTPPTTQKVLCTFAFAPRPPPPPKPPRLPHLPRRRYYALLPSPPDHHHPSPHHPTTHHHTTQPPTHPPIRYECVFYHRCIFVVLLKKNNRYIYTTVVLTV